MVTADECFVIILFCLRAQPGTCDGIIVPYRVFGKNRQAKLPTKHFPAKSILTVTARKPRQKGRE
jgi:hypothetical protein